MRKDTESSLRHQLDMAEKEIDRLQWLVADPIIRSKRKAFYDFLLNLKSLLKVQTTFAKWESESSPFPSPERMEEDIDRHIEVSLKALFGSKGTSTLMKLDLRLMAMSFDRSTAILTQPNLWKRIINIITKNTTEDNN